MGLAHDAFIYDLAWTYHDFVCELFGRWPVHWIASDQMSFTPVVQQYVKASSVDRFGPPTMLSDKERAVIAKALAAAKPPARNRLGVSLSNALQSRLDEIRDSIKFLVDDQFVSKGQAALTENETIVEVQFFDHLKNDPRPPPSAKVKNVLDYHNEIRASWKPRYKTSPLPRWKQRAIDLARERDNSKVLIKYTSLVNDIEPFEAAVNAAARDLDMAISQAIDEARGK